MLTVACLIILVSGIYLAVRQPEALNRAKSVGQARGLDETKSAFSPYLAKDDDTLANLDWELRSLLERYKRNQAAGVEAELEALAPHLPVAGRQVSLELLFATETDTSRFMESPLALRHQAFARGRLGSGYFEIDDLEELASQTGLRWIRPAYTWMNTGAITSQGDLALAAETARAIAPGYSGEGITIGVLSDSYDTSTSAATNAAADIATGDLPSELAFLADYESAATDEGRAMLQIIFDLAPGAALAFHTAKGGQAAFASAIETLRAQGCDIIVDDLQYLAEPMFQDGVVAQAIETVVSDGALYFSSAGNNRDTSWEDSYRPSNNWIGLSNGPLIDFDPGEAEDVFLALDVPVGRQISVVLQWSEPFASTPGSTGSASGFDLFLTGSDDSLTQILSGSIAPNTGLDPVELFTFKNDGTLDRDGTDGADTRFHLAIEHVSGPPPALLKIIIFTTGASVFAEGKISAPTLFGHANSAAAFAVGAAAFHRTPAFGIDPATVQGYSSLGGIPIYYDPTGLAYPQPIMRQKPEFVAADGVNTTFFGTDTKTDTDTFPNFFGTSAAAPHAAAIAALFLEKAGGPGNLDRNQTLSVFQTGALEMGATGFDHKTGVGLIQADTSLDATPLGFPAWHRLQLPGIENLTLTTDSDADLLPDVLEYYLGTLPRSPSSPPFTQRLEGETLVFEIKSADYLAAPLSLVEVSPDLIQWDLIDFSSITYGENGEPHTLRYEIPPNADGTDTFFRITPIAPDTY